MNMILLIRYYNFFFDMNFDKELLQPNHSMMIYLNKNKYERSGLKININPIQSILCLFIYRYPFKQ